ncbi:MAG: peptidylprolyl isomerase [Clostridiales bacterium]|nr:peptidylprolyl isomerase [Clostridiales bacterium]
MVLRMNLCAKFRKSARMTALLLAAAALASLFSCSSPYIRESTDEELETILYIGDYEVPFEQFYYFFMNYKNIADEGDDSYWESDDVDTEALFEKYKEQTISALLRAYATFSLCLKYDIDPDGSKVTKLVNETVNEYINETFGGAKSYAEGLESAFMTDSVFRFYIKKTECDTLLNEALIEAGVIKTDDNSIYSAIMDPDEFCHAKQILIQNDEGDDIEENYQLALEALTSAQLGADFDTLVAEYGEDLDMIANPKGYYFTHNELLEEFEEAAFALEIGELSGIVESDIGYHIILRLEMDRDYVTEYYDTLSEAYLIWKYQEAVEAEMANLTVTETELLKSLTMEDFYYSDEASETSGN